MTLQSKEQTVLVGKKYKLYTIWGMTGYRNEISNIKDFEVNMKAIFWLFYPLIIFK